VLGLLALCCMTGEGAAGSWSAVYLRDNLGTSAGFAAIGFAAFSIMMALGRLLGDRLAARFGPARLLRGCGLLAGVGLAAGLLIASPVAGVAGFALFGAGLSCTIPQLFSAAGNADPARPGSGLARVAGLGYLGVLGGPVMIGGCASLAGLPLALGVPVVLSLVVAASAGVLGGSAVSPSRPRRLPVAPAGQSAASPAVTGGDPAHRDRVDAFPLDQLHGGGDDPLTGQLHAANVHRTCWSRRWRPVMGGARAGLAPAGPLP